MDVVTNGLIIRVNLSGRIALRLCAVLILATAIAARFSDNAHGTSLQFPEILVLGDSQLSFGAGPVMLSFFKNIKKHCGSIIDQTPLLEMIEKKRTTLLGVRSTSLESWVTKKGRAWKAMCRKDKTWGVNASIWGFQQKRKTHYVQIGEGKKYQFCKKGKTPLEAMTMSGYYRPKLIMFYLLGNGAGRLAGNAKAATRDIERMIEQLPANTACIYMTTLPNYKKRINKTRLKAQAQIERAIAMHGNRCTFVRGMTQKVVAAIQGQSRYFRRKKSGKVKDPFHPDAAATKRVLALTSSALCRAVVDKLGMGNVASTNIRPSRDMPMLGSD